MARYELWLFVEILDQNSSYSLVFLADDEYCGAILELIKIEVNDSALHAFECTDIALMLGIR
jgi:hypothetical protein